MKNCTDLKQSKDLSEFLSPESADMYWWPTSIRYYIEAMDDGDFNEDEGHIRAWSLTALMDVLDRGAVFKTPQGWACQSYTDFKAITSDYYSNPIDACVAMIENLHKQKLL